MKQFIYVIKEYDYFLEKMPSNVFLIWDKKRYHVFIGLSKEFLVERMNYEIIL